jgi:1-acyl-sn-glycerol-3-phosphate acyltransferase
VYFHAAGRYPTFLIKASAFKVPFIGRMLYRCGQIPVNRGAADAALALKKAEQELRQGAAVIIYPEGTATRDPGLWPMVGKTGVARLALATGAPVIPVARWGTQNVLPYGSTKLKFWPRQTVRTVAGKPVDLSEWGRQADLRAGPARRHRQDHGRGDGPGGIPAGRGTARRPVRPGQVNSSRAIRNGRWFQCLSHLRPLSGTARVRPSGEARHRGVRGVVPPGKGQDSRPIRWRVLPSGAHPAGVRGVVPPGGGRMRAR